MLSKKFFLIAAGAFLMALAVGCSVNSPIVPNEETMVALSTQIDSGVLGAYELSIDAQTMTADLVQKRMSDAIGDSNLVSGLPFFTHTPCGNCFRIVGIKMSPEGDIAMRFSLEHPFEPGNTSLPPKSNNRLDLDIFDVALVIKPIGITPTTYVGSGVSIYDTICADQAGYTKEIANLFSPANTAVMPFFLVVDDSITGISTYNKFGMGTSAEFDVVFNLTEGGPKLEFDMYLTMGYGAAAKGSDKPSFLAPKYFNPEYNRKNAWKVVVTPPTEAWQDNDPTNTLDILVDVYDWQIGAVVSSNWANETVLTKVREASEVSLVQVDVLGTTTSVTTGVGAGTPADPKIFTVPVANSTGKPAGMYTGLVKVLDSRTPATVYVQGWDTIIDTPDGIELNPKLLLEFATYQTFPAEVEIGCGPIDGSSSYISTTCPQTITEGDSIAFVVGGVTSPEAVTYFVDYDWDTIQSHFNKDASSTTGTFSAHVFPTPGTYLVGFKAEDGCTPPNTYFFEEICEVVVEEIPPTVLWYENFTTAPADWWYQNYEYPGGGGCGNGAPMWSTVAPFGPSGLGNVRFGNFTNPANGGNVSTVVSEPIFIPSGTEEKIIRIYIGSDFSAGFDASGGMNFKIAVSSTPGLAPFSQTGAVGTTTILNSTATHGSTFPAMGMCGTSSQMAGQAGWDGSGQNNLPGSLTQYVDLIILPSFYGQTVKICFQWSPDICGSLYPDAGFALDDWSLIVFGGLVLPISSRRRQKPDLTTLRKRQNRAA